MTKRGNPNPKGSKPDKLMRDAIMVALNREATSAGGRKTKKMYAVADALVDKALAGDINAIKEVNDRVDGKSTQIIAGAEGGPAIIVEIVRFTDGM